MTKQSALLALGLSACAMVPGTGRRQVLLLSEAEETQLGVQSYQEVLQKEPISSDPAANELVTRVGQRIAAATGKNFAWEFKVIDGPKTVNAFCLPGGKVAVYTGILPVTADEAGLATVMGHEVAHAIARHGGERLSQGMLTSVGIGAVAAAMGSKDPATVKNVTAALGAGAAIGVLMPFGRTQESEADRLGLTYMAKAGYDPAAAIEFWKRMAAQSKGSPPEFLSTHPSDETRVRQLQKWLPEAQAHYQGGAAPAPAPAAPAGGGAPPPPPPPPPP